MQNLSSMGGQPGDENNIIRAFLSLNAIFAIAATYVFSITVATPDEGPVPAGERQRLKEYDTPRVVAMAEELEPGKLAAKGQLAEATMKADKLLAAKPHDILVNLCAGNVYMKSNSPQEGLRLLNRALALSHGNKYIRMNLAEKLRNANMDAEAIKQLKIVSKAEPKWSEPHMMLAQLYERANPPTYQLAADEYKAVTLINSNNVEAKKRRGILIARMGNPTEGLNEYMFGVNMETQSGGLPDVIEEMVKSWGGVDRTIYQLNTEISANPNEILPKVRLAQIYTYIGQYDKAKELLEDAKRISQDNAELHRTLSVVLKKLKEDSQADAEFNLSIALEDRANQEKAAKEAEAAAKKQQGNQPPK